ncbi:Rha family phage regulatory protein [Citrobacter portucalensis]|uniref:Rha family phage regulatory protein n=1 Tax=Citrobacter portucalensis TaxID=1639133 RepID=UPI00226AFFDB|nr:Rha family phage regulatory protein [Citrobacter portucalensis]MCX8984830.1 Rha family transcriptional regulator [Citrobacter portucalensis]
MMNAVLENQNGWRYSLSAPYKAGAGIGLLFIVSVPEHAPKACFLLPVAFYSMAAQAGASREAPGSDTTGKTNPVWATTNQIGLCCGSDIVIVSEAAIMATVPALAQPEVTIENGRAVTTSVAVAEFFIKLHKNVIQKIENLECSEEFNRLNFQPVNYTDIKGEKRPCYHITRNGFVFLVMGFTGKKAAAFKEAYIAEFDRMEAELHQQKIQAPAPSMPIFPANADFDLLTSFRNGIPVRAEIVPEGKMLLHPSDSVEMLKRTGMVVIHHKELCALAASQLISLCNAASKEEARWLTHYSKF